VKNTISRLSQNFAQTALEPPPPPPTTIGGHHKLLLLATRTQHGEECFNKSEILRIHLKDLVENKLPIVYFIVSLR